MDSPKDGYSHSLLIGVLVNALINDMATEGAQGDEPPEEMVCYSFLFSIHYGQHGPFHGTGIAKESSSKLDRRREVCALVAGDA